MTGTGHTVALRAPRSWAAGVHRSSRFRATRSCRSFGRGPESLLHSRGSAHDRDDPAHHRPAGTLDFPPVERARLSNGIELHSYHRPGQQIVAAHLVLEVPLSAEPREREGVATITTRCLDEGTRSHAGEEFAELLETEGAGFGVEIGLSGLQAVLDVPSAASTGPSSCSPRP